MAMVYVFLWTTLECSVELRFKLYSLLSWVLNTNGILCCYIKYSQSIQIFTPTKLIEYFCTVALSLESFVLLCSHTICHCFLLWQKMHFTRAQSKADEPGYHLKVFIRYLFGIWYVWQSKMFKQVVPPETKLEPLSWEPEIHCQLLTKVETMCGQVSQFQVETTFLSAYGKENHCNGFRIEVKI